MPLFCFVKSFFTVFSAFFHQPAAIWTYPACILMPVKKCCMKFRQCGRNTELPGRRLITSSSNEDSYYNLFITFSLLQPSCIRAAIFLSLQQSQAGRVLFDNLNEYDLRAPRVEGKDGPASKVGLRSGASRMHTVQPPIPQPVESGLNLVRQHKGLSNYLLFIKAEAYN